MLGANECDEVREFASGTVKYLKERYKGETLKLYFDDYMDEWYWIMPGDADTPMSPSFDNADAAIIWARLMMVAAFKDDR